jgi:hypothetical protein
MCVAKRLTLSAVGIAFLKSLQAKVLSKGGIVLAFQIFLRIISVWEDMALEPVAGREWVC